MFPPPMRTRTAILVVVVAAALTVGAVFALGGGKEGSRADAAPETRPGRPTVTVISPRNGARQTSHAVVVKVEVNNYELSGRHFGGEPQLAEGHIRFGLNRVPDCVDPVKLQRAIDSPFGKGRLVGRSFDFPEFAGPNGVLAKRIGSLGQLLAGDAAGDLLPRPPLGLLPTRHHPGPQRRLPHALPRRHQLPDPLAARTRAEVSGGQGAQRQGRRLRLGARLKHAWLPQSTRFDPLVCPADEVCLRDRLGRETLDCHCDKRGILRWSRPVNLTAFQHLSHALVADPLISIRKRMIPHYARAADSRSIARLRVKVDATKAGEGSGEGRLRLWQFGYGEELLSGDPKDCLGDEKEIPKLELIRIHYIMVSEIHIYQKLWYFVV